MPRPFLLLHLLFAAVLAFLPGPLCAQGPGRAPMRHYGNDEGLTSEVVTAVAQTSDGMIWAGTEAGLVFFGGRRFSPFPGALPSPLVRGLFADRDGALWVVTDGGVAWTKGGKVRTLGPAAGLPAGSCVRAGRDAQGNLWVLGQDALYRETGPLTFSKVEDLPVKERPVEFFSALDRPEALVLTTGHLLEHREGGWEILEPPPVGPKEEFLNLAEDGGGGLWLRSSRAMWYREQGGPWRRMKANMAGGFNFSSRLDRDRGGWVWFDDADGLWRMRGNRREQHGLPSDEAMGGMVDQEGGLWVRSEHGVQRALGGGRWRGWDTRDGLPAFLTWQPIRDRGGRLWVATDKGLCLGTPTGFRKVLPGRILTVSVAPDGRIWAAGSPGGTIFEVDPGTLAWTPHTVDVLPRSRITAGMAVDEQGRIWVADRQGGLAMGRRTASGWAWTRVMVGGRAPTAIYGLRALPGGRILLLHDGGASIFHHGTWKPIPDVLPCLPVAAACGADGKLAFGYRTPYQGRVVLSVHHLEGDQVTRTAIVPLAGPASNPHLAIFSVAVDDQGRVWVGTNMGLGFCPPGDGGSFRMIGLEDRLVSPECDEDAIFVEAGKVWVGTTAGLLAYDASVPEAPPALKAPLVLWARAGEQGLDPSGPSPRLSRQANLLELEFLIPTYQAPGRIAYEARLQGVDPGWVRQDTGYLRYPGLRAGDYVLELRGVLPDFGVEGPIRTFRFTVLPSWWETGWAEVLGLLALAVVTWLLVWLRQVALQARNRQLQEEVARQTRALQEASKAKSAFLANMSHELRTPLNAILLYAELLQEEAAEKGLSSTLEDAARIRQAGTSLLALIDDILDISKIEAGHMILDIQEIRLGEFLDRLDAALRPVVERNGNRFVLEASGAPAALACDPTRLQQILANLLSNAAKFTENGLVTLRAGQDGDQVVFEVADTGIGMTEEEQTRVFSEFVQADSSTTRKYGGTGLGLALVQRLTVMLGGQVELVSHPGAGTRVTVRLPGISHPAPAPGPGWPVE